MVKAQDKVKGKNVFLLVRKCSVCSMFMLHSTRAHFYGDLN